MTTPDPHVAELLEAVQALRAAYSDDAELAERILAGDLDALTEGQRRETTAETLVQALTAIAQPDRSELDFGFVEQLLGVHRSGAALCVALGEGDLDDVERDYGREVRERFTLVTLTRQQQDARRFLRKVDDRSAGRERTDNEDMLYRVAVAELAAVDQQLAAATT